MDSGQLDINILGTSFSIQANENPEYLQTIYHYYVERVQQVQKTVGKKLEPLQVAIIAGILLSDELQKERRYLQELGPDEQENFQVINRTKKIIEKLDGILGNEDLG